MKTNARRTRTRARAFTLLEVLMVVIIIGLLAAFVVPNLWDVEGKQRTKLAQAAVDSGLSGTLDLYRAAMGRYPTTDEGLIALYQPPDDEYVKTILDQNIEGERCAISYYNDLMKKTKDTDIITYNMVLSILSQEVEHEEDLQALLEDLELMVQRR